MKKDETVLSWKFISMKNPKLGRPHPHLIEMKDKKKHHYQFLKKKCRTLRPLWSAKKKILQMNYEE